MLHFLRRCRTIEGFESATAAVMGRLNVTSHIYGMSRATKQHEDLRILPISHRKPIFYVCGLVIPVTTSDSRLILQVSR